MVRTQAMNDDTLFDSLAGRVPMLESIDPGNRTPAQWAQLGIWLTCSAAPLELGCGEMLPSHRTARRYLTKAASIDWPEAVACRHWLELLDSVEASDLRIPEELAKLKFSARKSTFLPVITMAVRALCFFNRAEEALVFLQNCAGAAGEVAGLLFEEAGLQCQKRESTCDVAALRQRIAAMGKATGPINADTAACWLNLIEIELSPQEDIDPSLIDKKHVELLGQLQSSSETGSIDQHERSRLAGRVCASAARAALACGSPELAWGWLCKPQVSQGLPVWEIDYLTGITEQARKEHVRAAASLRRSIGANPHQSRVKAELGACLAATSPAEAYELLESERRSHDVISLQAALLLKQSKAAEAGSKLAGLSNPDFVFSSRLISRQARSARIEHGLKLLCEYSRAQKDWVGYLKALARLTGTDSRAGFLASFIKLTTQNDAPSKTGSVTLSTFPSGKIRELLEALDSFRKDPSAAGRSAMESRLDRNFLESADSGIPESVVACIDMITTPSRVGDAISILRKQAGDRWPDYLPLPLSHLSMALARDAVEKAEKGEFIPALESIDQARGLLNMMDEGEE